MACCNSWGRKESDTTERLNRTELNRGGKECHSFKKLLFHQQNKGGGRKSQRFTFNFSCSAIKYKFYQLEAEYEVKGEMTSGD